MGFLAYTSAVIWDNSGYIPQSHAQITTEPNEPATPPEHESDNSSVLGTHTGTNCATEKCIALTFDDGPTEFTDELLNTLEQYDVQATFFYLGSQVVQYPEQVKRAYANGHELGNHTWNHISVPESSRETILDQVSRTQESIKELTGITPTLFRPPGGDYKDENIAVVDLPFILWNIDPEEWRELDSETIYKTITQEAMPGAIIISHDTRKSTIDAYKSIIPDLLTKGYVFVTVSDLLDLPPENPELKAYFKYSQ
jgi:peptidoglycan-N-acetylglucosamine deacetylase